MTTQQTFKLVPLDKPSLQVLALRDYIAEFHGESRIKDSIIGALITLQHDIESWEQVNGVQ